MIYILKNIATPAKSAVKETKKYYEEENDEQINGKSALGFNSLEK